MLQLEIEGRNQQERDVALYTDDTWSIGILNKKTSLYIKISSHRLRSATKAFQLNSCLFFFVFGRRWWKLNWQERAEDKGVFRHAFYLIDGMMNSLDETESTWGRIERMYWVQYSVGKSNNRIWKLIRFSRFEKGEHRLSTRWHITNWNAYAPFYSVGINQLVKHGNSWQSIVHRNKKTYLNETSTCFPPPLCDWCISIKTDHSEPIYLNKLEYSNSCVVLGRTFVSANSRNEPSRKICKLNRHHIIAANVEKKKHLKEKRTISNKKTGNFKNELANWNNNNFEPWTESMGNHIGFGLCGIR